MPHEKELQYIRIGRLVIQELNGELAPAERKELEHLINSSDANRKVYDELINNQSRDNIINGLSSFDSEAAFARFQARTGNTPAKQHTTKTSAIKVWGKIVAAAAVFLVVAIASYFYFRQDRQEIKQQVIVQDIGPGGNKATLQLGNGKVIELDQQKSGIILSESGIKIIKTAEGQLVYDITGVSGKTHTGQYNTIKTPMGGQYQVRLPDNSKVWLNAASSLTYATSLNERGERRVRLESGEAYFEIAKDRQHPFIVSGGGQEVEVLGTHFNINTYSDEKTIKTTLLEGSVRVRLSSDKDANRVLKPGEQATVTGSKIDIAVADTESVIGWKDGLFVFHDADVPTVMRQLSRWYDIEVEYSGAIPTDLFTGGISRKSNLSNVLKMLELIKIRSRIVETENGKKLIINP